MEVIPKRAGELRTIRSTARRIITIPNFSLAFLLLCCLLIGKLEEYEQYLSLAMLAVVLLNWKNDELYIMSPIFLLFWEQFYVVGGSTPLYRVYSYLLLIRVFLDIGKIRFRPQFIPTLAVFACFCILSVGRMSMRIGLNLLADALLSYFILTYVRQKLQLMRRLTLVFALAAVCAGCYSLLAETVVSYETGLGAQVEIVRYYGTVGDANYASCFYNVAIFLTLCSDAMKKWYVRLPILGALVYFLLLTASQTGLLCLILGMCVYLILRYKTMGVLLTLGFCAGAALAVYALLQMPISKDAGMLSTLHNRLLESFGNLESGNVANLTTDRSVLWKIAMDYFSKQTWLNKLIGGNVIATIISEEYFLKAVGAIHQSYIQGLLDFGILGTIVVFGSRIMQTIADGFACLTGKSLQLPADLMRCAVLTSFIFLLYALTLDMFMDWRFLYLYFF